MIKSCSLSGVQVACYRSVVAALFFILLLPQARRHWSWRTLLVALAYAGTVILFVLANKLTTAAATIFLQSAAPVYILALSPWLTGDKFNRLDFGVVLVVMLGLIIMFIYTPGRSQSAPQPATGNLLAAASGITWAGTILGLRWIGQRQATSRESGLGVVLSGNLLAALLCAPWAWPAEQVPATDWWLIGFLGIFQIGVAYVLVTWAMPHVAALHASLLLLIEPVVNPVWAWFIHAEHPGQATLVGGGLVLLATLFYSWQRQKFPAKMNV
ncbi:MAG: hypothetical protein HJJLKODD_01285 [Phycisphaerae bacterium]|nr:hypothetical protein [Phycisphaerae bacterium]